jgi:hypothetical protein
VITDQISLCSYGMKYEVERRYMDDMILEIVVVMVCEFCNEEMREGLWCYL